MKAFVTALSCVVLFAGVSAAAPPTANELKQIGLAYHNYFDANRKAPSKAEDLEPYFEKNRDGKQPAYEQLKSDQMVFIYGVGILDMKDGTSNTIIAYPKDAAKDGGIVLYGDGSTRKLSADDFKKAILAKKPAK